MFKLSFQEERMKVAVQHTFSVIPGIEKLVSIYFSPTENTLKVESSRMINDAIEVETFDPSIQAGKIDYFRKKRTQYSWNKKEEIPYEKDKIQIGQLDVFSALEANILSLYIPNEYDHKNDLLFIFVKPQLQYYGILKDNAILSNESKSIIAELTRNSLVSLLSNIENDKKAFNAIKENTKTIINKQLTLKKEHEITKDKYGESVVNYAKLFLGEICEKQNLGEIYFTSAALYLIKKHECDINTLKTIIEEAAYYVFNMYSGNSNFQIEIDEIHLRFESNTQIIPEAKNIIAPQYYKTIQLLDKLELAVKNLDEQNLFVTSANVGGQISPPISAPAITDALKKHKAKILFLFDKYPEKWTLIRNNFKPIINIQPNSKVDIEKYA